MKFKFRGSPYHVWQADRLGRLARAIIKDYLTEDAEFAFEHVWLDEIELAAARAAHHANIVLDRLARPSLIAKMQENLDVQRFRQATTPRCSYTRITEEQRPDGSKVTHTGDPCNGKLKPKTRHRVLLGGECDTCGRFYPVPKEPDAAPVSVEAVAEASA